jgi:hypothetical protein
MVLQALHVLAGALDQCSSIYLTYGGRREHVFSRQRLEPPRPTCYVCQNHQVTLRFDPGMRCCAVALCARGTRD